MKHHADKALVLLWGLAFGVLGGCGSNPSKQLDATSGDASDSGSKGENTDSLCSDGLDNDGDGLTDCADGDCLGDQGITVCDADADGIADSEDNCPNTANADQADYDSDGLGDLCDDDADADGYEASEGDCDDLDENVHPGAAEIADGRDNDCSGQVDDGTSLAVYQVQAITDQWILPDSDLSEQQVGYVTSLRAAQGEIEPASFVVRAKRDLTSVVVDHGDLVGPAGAISADAVDVRVVKVWYQAGFGIGDRTHKHLTPELLVKDDSLVKVEGQDNFLKLATGQYVKISDPSGISGVSNAPSNDEFPVADSINLQPVDIPENGNKQFWITVRVPQGAQEGTYRTDLRISDEGGVLGRVQLDVEVLPFSLPEPMIQYSIYYTSRISDQGTISSGRRSEEQIRAELADLVAHGVTNPTVYVQWDGQDRLLQMLSLREDAGMPNNPFYYVDLHFLELGDPSQIRSETEGLLADLAPAGISELYLYAPDEQNLDTPEMRARMAAVQEAGAKVFDAQGADYAVSMADLLDLAVVAYVPDKAIADLYHENGHLVGSYANPQVGEERPAKYRRNYGLLLWQKQYDVAMDFAYDYSMNNIWNDFDHDTYRDHNFVYPTTDGVIDTIQWEGFREGVDDVRYLTLLLNLLEERGHCCDTDPLSDCCPPPVYSAYVYLTNLETDGLDAESLGDVRSRLIDFILWFLGKGPVPSFCGNGVTDQGEDCDTDDFAGKTCADFGYPAGHLVCKNCSVSLSGCVPARDSIRFIDPTPADGATVNQDNFTIAVHAESIQPSFVSIAFQGDDGLVAHWAFDENSGVAVLDGSPNGNDGTIDQGDYETADSGTTDTMIRETSTYRLSYGSGAYNGWFVEILDGAGSGSVTTVDNYVVGDIQNDKTIYLSSPVAGLAAGDSYHLYANPQIPSFAPGKYRGAVWLDGVDDYVQLGSDAPGLSELNGTGLTLSAWVNPDDPRSAGRIITKNGPFYLEIYNLMLTGGVYADGSWSRVQGHTPLKADQWQHVALVYDGSEVRLYVNGLLDGSQSQTGVLQGDGCVQIGRRNNGGCYGDPGHSFGGGIDDFFIYNRGLSVSELGGLRRSRIQDVSRLVSGLGPGTYQISAYAEDIDGNRIQTEVRTIHVEP